jgi:hypothetical protein
MRLLLPILVLVACTPDPVTTVAEQPGPTDSGMPATVDTADPTDPDPLDAASEVQQLIAGERDAADVIPAVAWADGWPLADGDTTWFVHLASEGSWSVAGDFNDWTPEPMIQGDGFVYLGVDGELPAGTGYKFVRDGAEWIADPFARAYQYDAYGELSYAVPPTDVPHLERWPDLAGRDLAPREVVVYVPVGDGPFDVLYAHDGQNLFDPAAIWGGWRLGDALASTPDVMVVGLFNTPDRMNEYVHVDDFVIGYDFVARGDDYAALLHEDLRPHIEAVYPTSGHDGLMGSSLGGLISLHIAQTYPGEYDFVASLSGTLGWGRFEYDHPTMEERWLEAPPDDIVVYVDSGGSAGPDGRCDDLDGDGFPEDDPDASDNYCETRQFADALAASGFAWDDTLFHWHELDAPHQENAWADRVFRPLQRFVEAR